MPVIGKRSNSGTLCISLVKGMREEGFVAGARATWMKFDGKWCLMLEVQQTAPAQPAAQPAQPAPEIVIIPPEEVKP